MRTFGRSTTFASGTEKLLSLPAEIAPVAGGNSPSVHQMVQAAGWPLESMYTVHWSSGFGGVPVRSRAFAAGVRAPRWIPSRSDERQSMRPSVREALPLRIYPANFAITASLYAGAWWLLLFAPGLMKRWRRRRRGRCVGCGYDLAGLAVEHSVRTCPECGTQSRFNAPA